MEAGEITGLQRETGFVVSVSQSVILTRWWWSSVLMSESSYDITKQTFKSSFYSPKQSANCRRSVSSQHSFCCFGIAFSYGNNQSKLKSLVKMSFRNDLCPSLSCRTPQFVAVLHRRGVISTTTCTSAPNFLMPIVLKPPCLVILLNVPRKPFQTCLYLYSYPAAQHW